MRKTLPLVLLVASIVACAGTEVPVATSAHGLPTRGMGEGEHLLFEPAPNAESLLGRRVTLGASGAWQVADAREPGCVVVARRRANAYAREYEAEIANVASLGVGVADLAALKADYGDRTILKLAVHNSELIEGDLRGACGEQVITAVRVGTGTRELGVRTSASGEVAVGAANVGAGGGAARFERIGDTLSWDAPQAWAFRVGSGSDGAKLSVRIPERIESGTEYTIEIEADRTLWLIVAYQTAEGRGALVYPRAGRREVVAKPGRPLVLRNQTEMLPAGQREAFETLLVYGFSAEADWQALVPAGSLSPDAASVYVGELPKRIEEAGIPMRRWTLQKVGYALGPLGLPTLDSRVRKAVDAHRLAEKTRRSCVERNDLELCKLAQKTYATAAVEYERYLSLHVREDAYISYGLHYDLAEALYWSEQFEKAAIVFARVRDWYLSGGHTHLETAALYAVKSLERLVDRESTFGELRIREAPPELDASSKRITPIALPPRLQQLLDAREAYVARVNAIGDPERRRSEYSFKNALLLHNYGHWDESKWRFGWIYELRCNGIRADDTGRAAWTHLRAMAEALGDVRELDRLSTDLATRKCTFSPAQY